MSSDSGMLKARRTSSSFQGKLSLCNHSCCYDQHVHGLERAPQPRKSRSISPAVTGFPGQILRALDIYLGAQLDNLFLSTFQKIQQVGEPVVWGNVGRFLRTCLFFGRFRANFAVFHALFYGD